jgi:uncharacterized membrane protein YkoI
MRQSIEWVIALAVVLSSSACATANGNGTSRAKELELIRGTKIEVTEAIKAALVKAPGRVIDTELREKQGRPVWEVDVVSADGKVSEVDVDANTGQVVDSE